MSYKMIVLDLDGTVINSSGRISSRTRAAVRAARDAGLLVLVATGRRLRSALPYVRELGLEGPSIFCNGALTVDLSTWHSLDRTPMGQDGSLVVSNWLDMGLAPLICRHDLKGPDLLYHIPVRSAPDWMGTDVEQGHLGHTSDPVADAAEALKLMLAAPERVAHELGASVGAFGRTMITYDGDGEALLEVWRRDVTKAYAIQRLAGGAGIERREIIAFGDNVNDVELLSFAGMGVAMGNAVPEAMAAARLICASCDEDGVAGVLESLVAPLPMAM